MIFRGFKRKSNQIFLNKKFKNLLDNNLKNSSKKVEKILVFLDDVSKKTVVKKDLINLFKISENEIDIIVFQQKKSKINVDEDVFSPKDFGWFGKVKSPVLKDILTKKYDLLINYSKVENIYCNLLLLQSKTSLRVAFSHLNNQFYDLLIQCKPSEIKMFNNELKKYLTILNK